MSFGSGELKIIQITLKVFRNFADLILIVIFFLARGGGGALLYGKTGVYMGIHYFSYFCSKTEIVGTH